MTKPLLNYFRVYSLLEHDSRIHLGGGVLGANRVREDLDSMLKTNPKIKSLRYLYSTPVIGVRVDKPELRWDAFTQGRGTDTPIAFDLAYASLSRMDALRRYSELQNPSGFVYHISDICFLSYASLVMVPENIWRRFVEGTAGDETRDDDK